MRTTTTNIATENTFPVGTRPCFYCLESSVMHLSGQEVRNLNKGMFIQDALPDRSASFREQVKTGIHPDCWDAIFADNEE